MIPSRVAREVGSYQRLYLDVFVTVDIHRLVFRLPQYVLLTVYVGETQLDEENA